MQLDSLQRLLLHVIPCIVNQYTTRKTWKDK